MPVEGNRPDLWLQAGNRQIGLEVTSRNIRYEVAAQLDRGEVRAGVIDDQRAQEDFDALWIDTIQHKLADFDGSFAVVLIVWDCNVLGDVNHFVTEDVHDGGSQRSFADLLAIHQPNCSPLSAILYLPYLALPQLALCNSYTTGPILTESEVTNLGLCFRANPARESGFLPPEDL
jgi:hypothetical protein